MPVDAEGGAANFEDAITPLMNILSQFRDQVKDNAGDKKLLFQLTDKLRDEILPY